MNILKIKDETAAGEILNEITLQFKEEYVSIEELISERVKQEVERITNGDSDYSPLVSPTKLEQKLNNKVDNKPRIDVEKQIFLALDAFLKNGYFILVDEHQAERLDQKFLVDDSTLVTFVKLTPLVGG